MYTRQTFKPSVSQVVYEPTGKDIPFETFDKKEDAYYMFMGLIEQKLGQGGGTISEIYHKVTGPMGLSQSDTIELIRGAKKSGYLK